MKIIQCRKILPILLLTILKVESYDESKSTYASVRDMETFVKTLSAVEDNLNSYVEQHYKRMEELKRYLTI